VKGPGDRLQDHQRLWLQAMLQQEMPVSVLNVCTSSTSAPDLTIASARLARWWNGLNSSTAQCQATIWSISPASLIWSSCTAPLRGNAPDIPVIAQTTGMSEQSRLEFIDQFRTHRGVVGFAVLGGAFSEGIDLPGDALVGVFIATLGLPPFIDCDCRCDSLPAPPR
jgi:hypothetical protein